LAQIKSRRGDYSRGRAPVAVVREEDENTDHKRRPPWCTWTLRSRRYGLRKGVKLHAADKMMTDSYQPVRTMKNFRFSEAHMCGIKALVAKVTAQTQDKISKKPKSRQHVSPRKIISIAEQQLQARLYGA